MKFQSYDRVTIKSPKSKVRPLTGLDAAFEGQKGTIVGFEQGKPVMFRVKLDNPIDILGVGLVKDDLWSGEYLKRS
jgi:hypothetical protein